MADEICEIEATVPTGFETTAREEVIEKLNLNVTTDRGKIAFHIPVKDVEKIKELQSVDNIYVVLKRYTNFKFSDNVADALTPTINIVPEIDWKHGLNVWRKFIDCQLVVSGDPVTDWETRLEAAKARVYEIYKAYAVPTANIRSGAQSSDIEKDKTDSDEQQPSKRPRLEHDPEMPTFRATCYRIGKGHMFQSPQAAAVFGGAIQDYFSWNVKMKDFDIEAVLDIEEKNVSVALALTKESMHRRHLTQFGPTTLRPTIAYGMLRLCKIEEGNIVCDPMCGGGSIPIEAALNWPSVKHMCGDFDERAVKRTQANVWDLNEKRKRRCLKPVAVSVNQWDSTELPLKDNSVDVFVSDMPFGKRSGSKMRNWHLYPKTLSDLARVSKRDTGRACLLTQDRKCMLKSLSSVKSYWTLFHTVMINIGGLTAGVYILHRNNQLFKASTKANSSTRKPEQCGEPNSS